MKEIKVGNISISLSNESGSVRVKSDSENVILANQSIENVSELIAVNFDIVRNHYESMVGDEGGHINSTEINSISLAIVLHYFYMYNSWKSFYKGQENMPLRFKEEDFMNTTTHDIIFNYYKTKYPNSWEEKCSILLGMTIDELKIYYQERKNFYNK